MLNEYQKFVKDYARSTGGLTGRELIKKASAEWRKITGKPKQPKRKPKSQSKKGGFLPGLLAGVAAPLIYDYGVKPAAKAIGLGMKKKQHEKQKREPRKEKKED